MIVDMNMSANSTEPSSGFDFSVLELFTPDDHTLYNLRVNGAEAFFPLKSLFRVKQEHWKNEQTLLRALKAEMIRFGIRVCPVYVINGTVSVYVLARTNATEFIADYYILAWANPEGEGISSFLTPSVSATYLEQEDAYITEFRHPREHVSEHSPEQIPAMPWYELCQGFWLTVVFGLAAWLALIAINWK